MADNIDEEHVDYSQTPVSESLSYQNNPTNDTDTTNPNQETENMEVHHHAHHEGKKNWKSYFWEFLMLFLAVFCGFLAENMREHVVENDRAHDYAKSFLNDLRADTTELNGAISAGKFMRSAMDSITGISLKNNVKTEAPGTFYYYSRFMSNLWTLDWSKSTINQLIQSGNLRYFKNKEIVNKINSYYAWQDLIIGDNQVEHETRMKLVDLRNKILLSKYYSAFASLNLLSAENGDIPLQIDSLIKTQLPLMPNAFMYMDEYINLIADRRWRQEPVLNGRYPKILDAASELIVLLKKEYKLE